MTALVAVLGAGAGSRMGGGKLGRDLAGHPLGMWSLLTAQILASPIVFIAPPEAPAWLDVCGVQCDVLANSGAGMASSLVLAAHIARQRQVTSLLVMLADMPFVSVETLHSLLALQGPDEVRACLHADGRLGAPACFGAWRLGDLSGLAGDAGARQLLNSPGFAIGMAVADIELMDIDTQEDLEKARRIKVRLDEDRYPLRDHGPPVP